MKLVLDIHNHTIASGHAYSTILEYINEAKDTGLELIAITDHAQAMPGSFGRAHFMNFHAIPAEVDGIKLMMGVELSILDKSGSVDMSDDEIAALSPVIASIHSLCYKFSESEMTYEEKSSEITEAISNAMDNKYIQIIGHPGEPRYPFDIKKIVRKSLDTGVLLEINAASLNESSFRRGSRGIMLEILKVCKDEECPIIIGSDAHFSKLTGKFVDVVKLLDEAGFPERLVANTSVEHFRSLLKRNVSGEEREV